MMEKKCLLWMGLLFFSSQSVWYPSERQSLPTAEGDPYGRHRLQTGMNAMTGAEQKWAYEQAVADINKKGGVFVKEYNKKLPVKLIFADDKSDNAGGSAAMERLIKNDKIDLALSTNITPINLGAATVCEKYKVYFSIVCSWLDFVEKEHFKWTIRHVHECR